MQGNSNMPFGRPRSLVIIASSLLVNVLLFEHSIAFGSRLDASIASACHYIKVIYLILNKLSFYCMYRKFFSTIAIPNHIYI